MTSIFQNIWPSHVSFGIDHNEPVIPVPLNQPLPHYTFPSAGGYLPGSAVPGKPATSIKAMLNRLPSLFNINHG